MNSIIWNSYTNSSEITETFVLSFSDFYTPSENSAPNFHISSNSFANIFSESIPTALSCKHFSAKEIELMLKKIKHEYITRLYKIPANLFQVLEIGL